MGKWILLVGVGLAVLGLLMWLGNTIGIPFGKLPGDLRFQGKKSAFYFPIVTSILISIFLTVLINLIIWLFRK